MQYLFASLAELGKHFAAQAADAARRAQNAKQLRSKYVDQAVSSTWTAAAHVVNNAMLQPEGLQAYITVSGDPGAGLPDRTVTVDLGDFQFDEQGEHRDHCRADLQHVFGRILDGRAKCRFSDEVAP